jgi:hypothetical protein
MDTQNQAVKNMGLIQELAGYLAKHPDKDEQTTEDVTYVAFSSTDEQLNSANEKLLASLVHEGRKVVKAMQTNDKFHPWKFSPVAF